MASCRAGHGSSIVCENLKTLVETVPTPRRVVLLGKGPSLQQWVPYAEPGTAVVAINEAATVGPCDYAIYVDRQHGQLDLSHTTPVRHHKWREQHDGRGYFFGGRKTDRCCLPPGRPRCTAGVALAWFGVWGVKDILTYGFDAYDGPTDTVYSDRIPKVLHRRENADYTEVNHGIRAMIRQFDLNVRWAHRGESFDA